MLLSIRTILKRKGLLFDILINYMYLELLHVFVLGIKLKHPLRFITYMNSVGNLSGCYKKHSSPSLILPFQNMVLANFKGQENQYWRAYNLRWLSNVCSLICVYTHVYLFQYSAMIFVNIYSVWHFMLLQIACNEGLVIAVMVRSVFVWICHCIISSQRTC